MPDKPSYKDRECSEPMKRRHSLSDVNGETSEVGDYVQEKKGSQRGRRETRPMQECIPGTSLPPGLERQTVSLLDYQSTSYALLVDSSCIQGPP